MFKDNLGILQSGKIEQAEKLEVLTFSLGEVGKLSPLPGVISKDADGTRITTKEATSGQLYDDERIAVARIIGGKVLMEHEGKLMYDIYALEPAAAAKKLTAPIKPELTAQQKKELGPLFDAASQVDAYLTPKEVRDVIVITKEMLNQAGGSMACRNSWEKETDPLTPLLEGDVFVVADPAIAKGYRIGAAEFAGTHRMIVPENEAEQEQATQTPKSTKKPNNVE